MILNENSVQTIERIDTLAQHAPGRLEQLIREGHFKPGHMLPSERLLGEQIGVSRTALRDAVRSLVAKSLLDVHQGRGTLVCAPSAQAVAQSVTACMQIGQSQLDCRKVHEVRRVLKVETADLAAEPPDDFESRRSCSYQHARWIACKRTWAE